ncbi:MAG: hypothetical protein QM773_13750 [Hyphomonadaceae bacterium]
MITLASFSPAEVAEITGLSTLMQRDWRRRGYLRSTDGHARFDPFDVLEVWSMKELADRGVGPVHSKDVAEWVAIGAMYHATTFREAYEGDHYRTFEWVPEKDRPKPVPDPRFEKWAEERGIELPPPSDISWPAQSQFLSRRVLRRHNSSGVIPARYLVWWADESHSFVESIDEAFDDEVSSSPKCAGPVMVRDLQAMGSLLIERAGRALVRVEYERDRTGSILSPYPEIEYGNFGGSITKVDE